MRDWRAEIYRIDPEAGVQRVGDRLLVAGADDFLHSFEDASGQVSEVAERIVELSDGRRTLGEIVDALCEEFEVDRATCEADATAFVEELVKKKILVRGPGAPEKER